MLHILIGDDVAAIKRRVRTLIPLATSDRHFLEHQTLADLERLLRLAESRSLLGHRSIWCRTPLLQKTAPIAVIESLQAAAQSLDTTLILSSEGIDKRLTSTKALLPFATVETYTLIAEWNIKALQQQAAAYASDVDLELNDRSLAVLVSRVGNQTELLINELEKLWLWRYHTQQPVTPTVIERLVGVSVASSLDLSRKVLASDLPEALTCLQALRARKEPEPKIIRTLDSQYRTWTRAKALLESGASNDAIATALKLGNPNRVYFLRRELQSVTLERLQRSQATILDTELALKQGQQGCLRALVLKLAA